MRPCGVDETLFIPQGVKQPIPGECVIGFVGSLKAWHDIESLAKAYKILASDPRYHLLIIGDGPMRKTIQALSDNLPGRVTWTGAIPQEEVVTYMRSIDIAVAPYPAMDLFYFSPLKAYEYMAMGKAIVATHIGQLATLLQHGENALLYSPGDISSLVKSIQHLANDQQLRLKMGTQARKQIVASHTWNHRAEYFLEACSMHQVC